MKKYKRPSVINAADAKASRAVPAVAAALLGGYAAGRLVTKLFDATAIEPVIPRLDCVTV